jgi:hypothetical protein
VSAETLEPARPVDLRDLGLSKTVLVWHDAKGIPKVSVRILRQEDVDRLNKMMEDLSLL